jgi:hypothetical protein
MKIEGTEKGMRIDFSEGRDTWYDLKQASIVGCCKMSRIELVRN